MDGAPYVFEYDSRNRVFAVRFRATVTYDVFVSFFDDAPAYIARCDVKASVVDFTDVDTFSVSPDAMRRLALRPEILPDPIPRVIIAPQPIMFGVARMFKTIAVGRNELHIVRSTQEAHLLLGIRDPLFERLTAPDGS